MIARLIDTALEATLVPSFTRIGIATRRRVEHWTALPRIDDRVCVVTGATSGLGLAAAARLSRLGARVVIVGRDPDRTERARRQIGGDAEALVADMSRLADVRELGARLAERYPRIDALVHNAGALTATRIVTADGLEQTIATHLVGPFLLTMLMVDRLAAATPGRVVFVASGGAYTTSLDIRALDATGEYRGPRVYAHAKRAQISLVEAWAPRLTRRGVTLNAVHPGWAATPGIQAALPRFSRLLRPLLRSPEEGADSICWLVAAPEAARLTGCFVHDRRPRRTYRFPVGRPSDQPLRAARLIGWLEERTATST